MNRTAAEGPGNQDCEGRGRRGWTEFQSASHSVTHSSCHLLSMIMGKDEGLKTGNTHALQPVAVRKVWTIFHFCSVNCEAIRYGEYMPEATRAAPKPKPVAIISNISVCDICVVAVYSR